MVTQIYKVYGKVNQVGKLKSGVKIKYIKEVN